MFPKLRKLPCHAILCGIALWATASQGKAQPGPGPAPAGAAAALGAPQSSEAELRARIERLERQNEQLMRTLQIKSAENGPPASISFEGAASVPADQVRTIVKSYLEEVEAKKKAAAAAPPDDGGYKVGTDLKMTARWNDGLLLETAHKDFFLHIGGWLQNDVVFFSQTRGTEKQVGDLEDGDFFRRVRLQMDGGFWQVGEFNMIIGLENTQKSIVSVFELWGGLKDIPVLGAVRIGRIWTPHGLEGDDTTSNRAMTFLERSSMSEAFYAQNFVTGIFQGNSILDQRVTYQSMLYVPNLPGNNSGDFFGDGEYGVVGRLTALPIYENDGRCLVHFGFSANWQHATRGGNEVGDPQFVRYSARQEQRDFAGDLDGTIHDGTLNPGDANRMVDTGNIQGDSFTVLGTEFLWIRGPLSLQAEYAFSSINAAVVGGKSVGDQWFNGGYVQLSYFLTGEQRSYDRRFGRFNGNYLVGPYTPFWLVRDETGRLNWGLGAWEVAARYSHLDLNSSGHVVQGGEMDGLTLGVNWYLNPNLKIQFQYIYDNRYHLAPGIVPGHVDGLGIRTQVAW